MIIRVDYTEEKQLRVAVQDTGPGMSEADLKKLFTPYVQVGGQAGKQGTGLGLSICKRLVEALGGAISVASEQGKGTTFAFRVDGAKGRFATYHRSALAGKRVGFLDLPPTLEALTRELLARRGLDVAVAGKENGDLESFDLLVCDHRIDRQFLDSLPAERDILIFSESPQPENLHQVRLPLLPSQLYEQVARCFGETVKPSDVTTHAEFKGLRALVVDDDATQPHGPSQTAGPTCRRCGSRLQRTRSPGTLGGGRRLRPYLHGLFHAGDGWIRRNPPAS